MLGGWQQQPVVSQSNDPHQQQNMAQWAQNSLSGLSAASQQQRDYLRPLPTVAPVVDIEVVPLQKPRKIRIIEE